MNIYMGLIALCCFGIPGLAASDIKQDDESYAFLCVDTFRLRLVLCASVDGKKWDCGDASMYDYQTGEKVVINYSDIEDLMPVGRVIVVSVGKRKILIERNSLMGWCVVDQACMSIRKACVTVVHNLVSIIAVPLGPVASDAGAFLAHEAFNTTIWPTVFKRYFGAWGAGVTRESPLACERLRRYESAMQRSATPSVTVSPVDGTEEDLFIEGTLSYKVMADVWRDSFCELSLPCTAFHPATDSDAYDVSGSDEESEHGVDLTESYLFDPRF